METDFKAFEPVINPELTTMSRKELREAMTGHTLAVEKADKALDEAVNKYSRALDLPGDDDLSRARRMVAIDEATAELERARKTAAEAAQIAYNDSDQVYRMAVAPSVKLSADETAVAANLLPVATFESRLLDLNGLSGRLQAAVQDSDRAAQHVWSLIVRERLKKEPANPATDVVRSSLQSLVHRVEKLLAGEAQTDVRDRAVETRSAALKLKAKIDRAQPGKREYAFVGPKDKVLPPAE